MCTCDLKDFFIFKPTDTTRARNCRKGRYAFLINFLFLALYIPNFVPSIYMFETQFTNLNLTIGDYRNVTRIHWGIWRACFDSAVVDKQNCTSTQTLQHRKPYIFTLIEDNNKLHAAVDKGWENVMYAEPVVVLLLLTITNATMLFIFLRWNFEQNNFNGKDKRMKSLKKKSNDLCTLIVSGSIVMPLVALTPLAVSFAFLSISLRMQSLGTGGMTKVVTKPTLAFNFTLVPAVLLFLFLLVCVFFTRFKRNNKLAKILEDMGKSVEEREKLKGTYKIEKEYHQKKELSDFINKSAMNAAKNAAKNAKSAAKNAAKNAKSAEKGKAKANADADAEE